MVWPILRRKPQTELKLLRQEIAFLREQISGLRDSVQQIVTKSSFAAPQFVYAPLAIETGEELEARAKILLKEFGEDWRRALIKAGRHTEAFLLDYLKVEETRGSERLYLLQRAIQSEQNHSEFQQQLFCVYKKDFQAVHSSAIQSMRKHVSGGDLLVIHLSCRPRAHLAKESADTFLDPGLMLRNIIVVGHNAGKAGAYHFDPGSNVLVVPANDAYEGLGSKAAATYAFLEFAGIECSVLKVDDDVRCLRPAHLVEQILPELQTCDYMGRVWHATYGFSRTWHMGKCEDAVLNKRPYGLLTNSSYAEGPGYVLSPRSVHVLGKSAIYLENQFEVEAGYEDLAVGKILNHYGIIPTNIDFIKERIFASTDDWMMQRAGLV